MVTEEVVCPCVSGWSIDRIVGTRARETDIYYFVQQGCGTRDGELGDRFYFQEYMNGRAADQLGMLYNFV